MTLSTGFAWNPPAPPKAPPTGHPDDKYMAPEGTYKVEITNIEERITKKGDGKYLRVSFAVVEPKKYDRKLIFINITTENRSEIATKIGIDKLQKLCESALGRLPEPNITTICNLLLGKQVMITVVHKVSDKLKDDGTPWPKFYEVTKYEPVNQPTEGKKVVYQMLTGVSATTHVMDKQTNTRVDPELDDALPF